MIPENSKNMKISKNTIVIAAVIVGITILALLYQKFCLECLRLEHFKPENIRAFIQGFGPWAVAVYIGLYALNTITLLPPIGIMSLSAGALLGPVGGTVGIMAGSFLGTSATFFISRYLGGPFVQKIVTGKVKEFQDKLGANGFKVILAVRLIPVLPWEVVNYAAGLSKMKYRDYITATLIGIFPAVVIQVFASHSAAHFNIKDPKIWAALAAFAALMIVPGIYLKKRQ